MQPINIYLKIACAIRHEDYFSQTPYDNLKIACAICHNKDFNISLYNISLHLFTIVYAVYGYNKFIIIIDYYNAKF